MKYKVRYAIWGIALIFLFSLVIYLLDVYGANYVFINLVAFVNGKQYDSVVLLISVLTVLLLTGITLTPFLTLTAAHKEIERSRILQLSDGLGIQEENRQKILQLQQLLGEEKAEAVTAKSKLPIDDLSLDMEAL